MNDYILFMHDDVPSHAAEVWNGPRIAKASSGRRFQGGSAIGGGVCASKRGSAGTHGAPVRLHPHQGRGPAQARELVNGNPVFEAGGTVEIRELPMDRPKPGHAPADLLTNSPQGVRRHNDKFHSIGPAHVPGRSNLHRRRAGHRRRVDRSAVPRRPARHAGRARHDGGRFMHAGAHAAAEVEPEALCRHASCSFDSHQVAMAIRQGATTPPAIAPSSHDIDLDVWSVFVATVAADDIVGMGNVYFPDAVLVRPRGTEPIKQTLDGWGRDMVAAKAKGNRATVEFRFSRRQDDATTAFDAGIFRYTVIEKSGASRLEVLSV